MQSEKKRRPIYKRWWLYPALLVLVAALLWGALFAGIVVNASRLDNPVPADAMIVLGAGINEQGLPKPMLERRLNRAAELYGAGYAPVIIVTGAKGEDEPISEARSMKTYLLAKGLPPEAVIEEDASYNTRQNLAYAKMIMEERGLVTAIVVSSDYHLWRALSICRDLGLEATAAGAQNALTRKQALINCAQETLSWLKYLVTR